MPGSRRARSTSAAADAPEESITPCCAPELRRTRTSRRVSTPSIPTTPCRASQAGSASSARQLDGSRDTRRAMNPATCGASACSSP